LIFSELIQNVLYILMLSKQSKYLYLLFTTIVNCYFLVDHFGSLSLYPHHQLFLERF